MVVMRGQLPSVLYGTAEVQSCALKWIPKRRTNARQLVANPTWRNSDSQNRKLPRCNVDLQKCTRVHASQSSIRPVFCRQTEVGNKHVRRNVKISRGKVDPTPKCTPSGGGCLIGNMTGFGTLTSICWSLIENARRGRCRALKKCYHKKGGDSLISTGGKTLPDSLFKKNTFLD